MKTGSDIIQSVSEDKWGRKMGTMINLIQSIIRSSEVCPKILVYSQWQDSLSMLRVILECAWRQSLMGREVNINCILMTRDHNYRSTTVFKESADIPVLLMLLQQGNNGLDMSIASHIIIMEPILSASEGGEGDSRLAMEAQAVARVQRIGQTQETCVHYVIADDTIESKMWVFVFSLTLATLSSRKGKSVRVNAGRMERSRARR